MFWKLIVFDLDTVNRISEFDNFPQILFVDVRQTRIRFRITDFLTEFEFSYYTIRYKFASFTPLDGIFPK